jgi:excisionase family DNA binding protein
MQWRTNLSTIEVARMLGVAVSSVSRWIDEGKLIAGRTPGGHRRIERDDLIKFLRQQKLRIPSALKPSRPKVLIVDDDKQFAQWLQEEIQERFPDCDLALAFNGYTAGEIIGHSKPQVIILDLRMPGIDGFEVCSRLKSNPLFKDTCVIAVTADTSAEASSRILEMGVHACLTKPLDLNALTDELAKSLGQPV